MAALLLLVLLVCALTHALMRPLVQVGDAVLSLGWLVGLPVLLGLWLLLADDSGR